jgi:hypothetical protein
MSEEIKFEVGETVYYYRSFDRLARRCKINRIMPSGRFEAMGLKFHSDGRQIGAANSFHGIHIYKSEPRFIEQADRQAAQGSN